MDTYSEVISNTAMSSNFINSLYIFVLHVKLKLRMNIFNKLPIFIAVKTRNTLHRRDTYEPRHEKTNVPVSDLARHKPGCTGTEDG